MIIEGAISVKAAVLNSKREVYRIYIDEKKKSRDLAYIIARAKEKGIEVIRCSRERIDELSSGKTHGGIIAEVSAASIKAISQQDLVGDGIYCLLEGIEDFYNLGYISRTLYAFGVKGLILPRRNWNQEEAVMIKSSAGASEYLNIYMSDDLEYDLGLFKDNGYKVISACRNDDSVDLYSCDLKTDKLLFCIGGPLRGLSKAVLANSDQFVYIPYANDFRNALNAASAASVIASEIYRQNRKEHE